MTPVDGSSSPSDLAVFGRYVPAVFCAGPLPGYRRFERGTKVTGPALMDGQGALSG